MSVFDSALTQGLVTSMEEDVERLMMKRKSLLEQADATLLELRALKIKILHLTGEGPTLCPECGASSNKAHQKICTGGKKYQGEF